MSKRSRRSKTSEASDGGTAVAEPARTAGAGRRAARRRAASQKSGPQFDLKGFLISALIILVVVSAIYGKTASYSFVNWDDDAHVYANPYLTNPDGPDIGHFWSGPYQNLYIPATYTLWALVSSNARVPYKAGQPPFDPHAFHITTIVLHSINSLLVLLLLHLLLRRGRAAEQISESAVNWAAAIGALIFAVHPLAVESVGWISETKGLLECTFAFTALICYVLYASKVDEPSKGQVSPWVWFGLSTAAFTFAMLSKPNAVSLPIVALALDVLWLGRRIDKLLPLAGWLVIAAIFVVKTSGAQPVHSTDTLIPALWQRPLVAGDAIAFYLWKLFLPIHLNNDYGRPPFWVLEHSWVYATAVVPFVLLALVWRAPAAVKTGAGVFVAALLPVLGLIPFIYQVYSTVADRYAYLALLGLALVFAWIAARKSGPMVWSVCGVIIAVLGILSFIQANVWHNSEALFRHSIYENPRSWGAYGNLAKTLNDEGKIDQAEELFRKAIAVSEARPKYLEPKPEAYNGLGVIISVDHNRPADAIPYYDRALSIQPSYPEAHLNKAFALDGLGRHDEAIQEATLAVQYRPAYADAECLLGVMYGNLHDTVNATAHFQKAVDLEPDNTQYQDFLKRSQQAQPPPASLPGIH